MLLDIAAFATGLVFIIVGVWSLHTRFQRQEEWRLLTQVIVLAGVTLFYLIEIPILRYVLRDNIVYFIFALLGLFVAGLALYGHIAVSVISRILVELLIPDNPANTATPRLGPAEALERQQDWEGALHEYYILARIYPRNPMLCVRAANNLLRLNRETEAIAWLERAIKYTQKPEDNLTLVRRLCDALESLDQPEKANAALRIFAKRFSEHESGKAVARTLNQEKKSGDDAGPSVPDTDMLAPLDDAPISQND